MKTTSKAQWQHLGGVQIGRGAVQLRAATRRAELQIPIVHAGRRAEYEHTHWNKCVIILAAPYSGPKPDMKRFAARKKTNKTRNRTTQQPNNISF